MILAVSVAEEVAFELIIASSVAKEVALERDGMEWRPTLESLSGVEGRSACIDVDAGHGAGGIRCNT